MPNFGQSLRPGRGAQLPHLCAYVMNCVSNSSDTRFSLLEEILAKKQVFGWVAGDRKLGENHNSAPQHVPGLFAGADNSVNIAINITEVKIKLSKPDGKCFH